MIAAKILSEEQVNRFDRDGAVTVDGPFTAEEIKAAAKVMDEMLPYEESKKDDYDATRVTRDNISKGGKLFEYYNPALMNIYQHPFFEGAAQQLLYTDEITFNGFAMSKTYPLRISKKVSAEHVDGKYRYSEIIARPRRIGISSMIYLTDVPPDRAPLKFWPGSHIPIGKYYDEHPELIDADGSRRTDLPDFPYGDPSIVLAKAGEVTIFINSLLHGASENTDSEARKVMYLGLKPKALKYQIQKRAKEKTVIVNFFKEMSLRLPADRRHMIPEIS
jgi:ectoine hydroxylase-related dioxygenase (phytanoyl-CoA dioxygenase family)